MMSSRLRHALPLLVAALLLHLVLIQPNHLIGLTWGRLVSFPLELPLILFALLALGRTRAAPIFRGALTAVLTLIAMLKLADMISFDALSRNFNPVSDLFLVDAFIRLLSGTIGPVLTGLALIAAVLAVALLAVLIWWATGVWSRVALPRLATGGAAAAAVLAATVVVADVGDRLDRWELAIDLPGTAFTSRLGLRRAMLANTTLAELRAFRSAMMEDPFASRTDLFAGIDRDVIVIFIESYGRTSFDTPFYADLHLATLSEQAEALAALGLSTRSGFLTAPTQGGQSWLSHATLANGLWVDNQVSYGAVLSSGRQTLYHHAANAGFRTATVMPQITLDWPESARMGFETVLVAEDLGYEGLNFNWVTMPDQFSLTALDRLLRTGTHDRPLFAQVALVSSHAPWTPVPDMLPWDAIGDGTEFNAMAQSGDTPAVVWRDRDRVRAQYRLALDYSLQAVMGYAALHADDPPLLIVVGDHQAAGSIALDDRAEVPLHVIGPATLVDQLQVIAPDPGLIPEDGRAAIPMDAVRDLILTAFAAPTETALSN
ncbi:MAG: sulfatase-like hydrolase/transferase [Pseudomonadota bacterium]